MVIGTADLPIDALDHRNQCVRPAFAAPGDGCVHAVCRSPVDEHRSRSFNVVGVQKRGDRDAERRAVDGALRELGAFVDKLIAEDEPLFNTMRFRKGVLVASDRHLPGISNMSASSRAVRRPQSDRPLTPAPKPPPIPSPQAGEEWGGGEGPFQSPQGEA
jgi:hypothetical protein